MEKMSEKICPICTHVLYKRYEGLVCKNYKCKLYFKLGRGWVFITKEKTREEVIINDMWNNNSRLRFIKEWVKIKNEVLVRDKYKCQFCEYNLTDDFFRRVGLDVHHIIPAAKQSALYLDKDNLITVCNECHDKLHSNDKHKFLRKKS